MSQAGDLLKPGRYVADSMPEPGGGCFSCRRDIKAGEVILRDTERHRLLCPNCTARVLAKARVIVENQFQANTAPEPGERCIGCRALLLEGAHVMRTAEGRPMCGPCSDTLLDRVAASALAAGAARGRA